MADQANDNIFGSNQPAGTPGDAGTSPNANSSDLDTMLGSIKNERGEPKYKTVADALKALGHAQQYIPELKSKEQELEQKLNDALTKLSKMDELERTVLELTQRKPDAPADKPAAGITAEQVAELVRNTLNETNTQAAQAANLATVTTAVRQKFGDKAEESFYAKAKELGISSAEFNAMAAKNPKVVLKLIGADVSPQETRQSASFNTSGFQPTPSSNIGRNTRPVMTGATSQDFQEEAAASRAMVEELHASGRSVYDLTDPKVFFKTFGAR